MKRHARLGGKYLMGAALTGAVLYLVTTATAHRRPLWPYLILAVAFVLGAVLYLLGQERPAATPDQGDQTGQEVPPGQQAPAADPAPARSMPLITNRWKLTNDGHRVPTLMHLRNNSMSHPGYTSLAINANPPPSMRIGVVVPCEPLGPTPATSDIRARFLDFLVSNTVNDALAALTSVNADANWAARDGRGRFNFGAVLEDATDAAPVAWARLLLPQADALTYGLDPRSAVLILHVYLRANDGSPVPAANLAAWHDRFTRGLAVPNALATFLTEDLGLATSGEQPAQVGVYLDAPHSMIELVDIGDLISLPGSPASNWFMGWAISDPDGQQAQILAREWLTQMCDNTLHVDAYEPVLEALTNPRQAASRATIKSDLAPTAQNAPPLTSETGVQRLKQALADPIRRVELSDLVDHEIQELAAQIADTTQHPLGGVPFTDQLTAYEKESATSACLLATGVFHGDETQVSLWIRSLRRLMSARRPIEGSYNGATEAMRHYPALLCLWAMGLSAILADREDLLARLLLEPTWTSIFGDPKPQPAVHCLNPNRIIAAPDATPDGRRWLYPQSHHIRAASRDTLSQIEPDDDTYKKACDRLEYLASLLAMDTDAPNGLPWAGEFIPRSGYLNQDGPLSDFTNGGAFGSDLERARAARQALVTWITQHPRF